MCIECNFNTCLTNYLGSEVLNVEIIRCIMFYLFVEFFINFIDSVVCVTINLIQKTQIHKKCYENYYYLLILYN